MNNKGFTLIELIAVIVIMIIASIIVTTSMSKINEKNDEKRYNEFKTELEDAACTYIGLNENSTLRESCRAAGSCFVLVSTLVDEGFISDDLVNPQTGNAVDQTLSIQVYWSNGVKNCILR